MIEIQDLNQELSLKDAEVLHGGEPVELRIAPGGDLYKPAPQSPTLRPMHSNPSGIWLKVPGPTTTLQPYIHLEPVIALKGVYPSRN
jgi:hypothetical protein